MSIRLDHVHESGKRCYAIGGRHRLERAGLFRLGLAAAFAAAYTPYTGHWYAWNPKTGRQIATFTREFFDEYVAPFRCGDLKPDPECVPA